MPDVSETEWLTAYGGVDAGRLSASMFAFARMLSLFLRRLPAKATRKFSTRRYDFHMKFGLIRKRAQIEELRQKQFPRVCGGRLKEHAYSCQEPVSSFTVPSFTRFREP
jgi:hypothetical protein